MSLFNVGRFLLSKVGGASGRGGCEASVLSVQARILLPDPPDAAAGDQRVRVSRRDPKPPADVQSVGAVPQGGRLRPPNGRRQRLLVEEDGLQQRAAQHQLLEQRRGGDADAGAPPAAQLLLREGGGGAAVAFTPRRTTSFRVLVRFTVEAGRSVGVGADVQL